MTIIVLLFVCWEYKTVAVDPYNELLRKHSDAPPGPVQYNEDQDS